jgi:hypothetical protein
MRLRVLIVFGLLGAAGCGGQKYAPVSGRVTLNGKPLANATVEFQPATPPGTAYAPAPGSSGKTNANGEYRLLVATGETGAWVGTHRVMINAYAHDVSEGDERPRGGPKQKNVIPVDWRSPDSKQTFEVPPGGTDKADFDIKTTK